MWLMTIQPVIKPNIEYLEIFRVVTRHFAAYPEARKIVPAALGRL